MIQADKKQKQIIAILTKNDKDFKAELVVSQTKDQSKRSTNDLTFYQANKIIQQLGGNPVVNRWVQFDANNKQHRTILSLLLQMGWHFYNKSHGRYFANMGKFGGWLQSEKSPVRKPLVDQEPKETSKIIVALKNMV